MGSWTSMSVTRSTRHINENYGTTFQARFKLKYSPSTFGGFSEMPKLQWKEKILLIDRIKGEYWRFDVDQYARLPDSGTLRVWPNRYVRLYNAVWYQDGPTSQVYMSDKHGRALPKQTFGKLQSDGDKATAVRKYLAKNGGIVEIEVIDTPALLRPQPGRPIKKERYLAFDCGLKGKGARVTGLQHVRVDSDEHEDLWDRSVAWGSGMPVVNLDGLTKVDPPTDVTRTEQRGKMAATGYYP